MKNIKEDRTTAFFLSAATTIAIIGSMIIIHEQSTQFKELLNSLTGHHWLTKSVFAIILYPLLATMFYFLFGYGKVRKVLKADDIWLWSLIIITITLVMITWSLITYILHYFTI